MYAMRRLVNAAISLGKVRTAYGIEGNARAIAARDAHHFGDHVLLLGCDDMCCAGLMQPRPLLRTARQ